MSANQETQEEDDRIFPIFDRETPILDRIRQRREQLNGASADNIAQEIAHSALTGESVNEDLLINLQSDIASELEIPEDQISSTFISQLGTALSPSLDELVSQRQIGLQEPESESEDASESEEESETEEEEEESEQQESENTDSSPAFPDDVEEDEDEPDSVF